MQRIILCSNLEYSGNDLEVVELSIHFQANYIKEFGVPVIFVTAKISVSDRELTSFKHMI